MDLKQTKIDFDNAVHNHENNAASQSFLEKNRKKFGGQCRLIFNELMKGGQMTTLTGVIDFGIGDVTRRMHDLIEKFGIMLSNKWDEEEKYKIWYMSDTDKEYNKRFEQ